MRRGTAGFWDSSRKYRGLPGCYSGFASRRRRNFALANVILTLSVANLTLAFCANLLSINGCLKRKYQEISTPDDHQSDFKSSNGNTNSFRTVYCVEAGNENFDISKCQVQTPLCSLYHLIQIIQVFRYYFYGFL
jgi:hypothetical protein